MKKQVVVVGLGRFGSSMALTLAAMGHDVLAVDVNARKTQSIASVVTHVVQADATNEVILRELGVANFDVAIVAIGSSIEASLLSTLLLKKLNVPYVIAKAESELHGSILEKIGADKVVYPEREMGQRIAHELSLPDVLDYMSISHNYGVAKFVAQRYFAGKSLSDLGFGRGGRWGIAVLLIQREREAVVTPDRTEMVRTGDVLVVAGNDDKLEEFLAAARTGRLWE